MFVFGNCAANRIFYNIVHGFWTRVDKHISHLRSFKYMLVP